MKILNEYFKNTEKLKFLSIAAFLIFLSDVINICYINLHFLPTKITTDYLLRVYSMMGVGPYQLNTHYLSELRQVMIGSMSFLFMGFLIYHCFVYFKLSRNKKWAKKYVFAYSLTGAILTLVEMPFLIQQHLGWSFAMLVTTSIYSFTFLGLRFYKERPVSARQG